MRHRNPGSGGGSAPCAGTLTMRLAFLTVILVMAVSQDQQNQGQGDPWLSVGKLGHRQADTNLFTQENQSKLRIVAIDRMPRVKRHTSKDSVKHGNRKGDHVDEENTADVEIEISYFLPNFSSSGSAPDSAEENNISVSEDSETEEDFNVTAAIVVGARAQYDLCGTYCRENSTLTAFPLHSYVNFSCIPCYCDSVCLLYGDCCFSHDNGLSTHIDRPPNLCVNVLPIRNADVIASCLPNAASSQEIVKACSTCRQDLGVHHHLAISLDTHALYCNHQCALCNNESNITILATSYCHLSQNNNSIILDANNDNMTRSLDNHSQEDSHAPVDGDRPQKGTQESKEEKETPQPSVASVPVSSTQRSVRLCPPQLPDDYRGFVRNDVCNMRLSQVVTRCNSSLASELADFQTMQMLCQQYHYPVKARTAGYIWVVYRNLFCALCNGVAPGPNVTFTSSVIHFSGIIKLTDLRNSETKRPNITMNTLACEPEDHWQDNVLGMCRWVMCQASRQWSRGQGYCRDNISNSEMVLYLYRLALVVTPHRSLLNFTCSEHWDEMQYSLVQQLAEAVRSLNVTTYLLDVKCRDNTPSFSKVSACVELAVVQKNDTDQISFELQILDTFTKLPDLLVNTSSERSLRFSITERPVEWWYIDPFMSFDNGSCCLPKDGINSVYSIYEKAQQKYRNVSMVRNVLISRLTPYAQVLLNASEYILNADGAVILLRTNTTLDPLQLREDFLGLYVTLNHLRQVYMEAGLDPNPTNATASTKSQGWRGLELVSTCCLLMSVVSLVFLLITYCAFTELRTLPGINTMFLASWLLLAQLLLLSVPDRMEPPWACRILGILLHYAWLCVVSWCSMCSFHMFHVFAGQRNRAQVPHRHAWYVRRYVLLANGGSALVVLAVLLGASLGSGGHDLGYGGYLCYLNSVLLVGLGFVLPLSLAMLLNATLLALTARALSQVNEVQRQSRLPERSNLRAYAGLSSLTGLCWVVALLAEIPGCGWLHYGSAVLNGLQGLHLALCYTANRRVLKLWRQKFARGKLSLGRSMSSSAMSGQTARTPMTSISSK